MNGFYRLIVSPRPYNYTHDEQEYILLVDRYHNLY